MTNVRCKQGKEIDLLAINPRNGEKYHIESRISTAFKLKEKATRKRNGMSHKNGLDYFKAEKFEHQAVLTRIKEIFGDMNYSKVLVVCDTDEPIESFIPRVFKEYGVQILLMKDVIKDLRGEVRVSGSRDEIMRLLELIEFEDRRMYKKAVLELEHAVRDRKVKLPNDKRKELLWSSRTLRKYGAKSDKITSTRIFLENIKARLEKSAKC